jgi:hypothetical protein
LPAIAAAFGAGAMAQPVASAVTIVPASHAWLAALLVFMPVSSWW